MARHVTNRSSIARPVASVNAPSHVGNQSNQNVTASMGGAPAVAPAVQPQPLDQNYEAYKLSAGRNVALAGNEAAWQNQNLGYNLGIDANGQANAANPYSQAQLLQDSYHQSQLGTTNNMAAQGQLYAGATQNAQGINDRNYAINYAGLQQRALQGYHGVQSGQLGSYASNAAGVSDADFNALLKAAYGGG